MRNKLSATVLSPARDRKRVKERASGQARAREKGSKPVGKWNGRKEDRRKGGNLITLSSRTHTMLKSKRKPIFICTKSRFPYTNTSLSVHASQHTHTHKQHSSSEFWLMAAKGKNIASFFHFFFFFSCVCLCFFFLLSIILFVSVSVLLSRSSSEPHRMKMHFVCIPIQSL